MEFVGSAWRNDSPVLNDGPECHFTHPRQQCPHQGLIFASGPRSDSQAVIPAWQGNFRNIAALKAVVRALGASEGVPGALVAPHLEAEKGTGRTVKNASNSAVALAHPSAGCTSESAANSTNVVAVSRAVSLITSSQLPCFMRGSKAQPQQRPGSAYRSVCTFADRRRPSPSP